MSEHVYLLTICLPLLAALIIFAMRYASQVLTARAAFAQDEAYRQLAIQAAGAQAEATATLIAIETRLAELAGRMGAVEKVLKDVE
jgi:hypothetical protein